MRSTFLLSTVLASLVLATPAFAQDESEPGDEEAPKPKKKAKPAAAPAAAESSTAGGQTDHDRVVGRLGIGYLGNFQVPLGETGRPLPAHVLGMRYWFGPGMGLTAGLGFSSVSGSSTTGNVTTDSPAATAFAIKGGLPLALATSKHFAFVIEPQLAFGYAMQTETVPNQPSVDHTGQRFALGATAGAEIQFGFMGIPELSLVGSVGLAFDTAGGKTKRQSGENSFTASQLTTFSVANPWDIFKGSIAAIYYL
ncbi:MAG: hypothetical protein HYV09_35495 [Deltaproteobacteria bacterium]|nr:hypothetical protein [Deltaproteobacteria bacterium]